MPMSQNHSAPIAPSARALARWQHAAGPFWPYVAATPFLSASAVGVLPAGSRTRPPAFPLAALLAEHATAAFLDLPPAHTLPLAPALTRAGLITVPIIQRWAEPGALLPGGPLVAALIRYGALVARPRMMRGAVFLLDGE